MFQGERVGKYQSYQLSLFIEYSQTIFSDSLVCLVVDHFVPHCPLELLDLLEEDGCKNCSEKKNNVAQYLCP